MTGNVVRNPSKSLFEIGFEQAVTVPRDEIFEGIAHRIPDCLRFGVACGAESTQRLGAGLIDAREVERLVGEVSVERVTEPAAA